MDFRPPTKSISVVIQPTPVLTLRVPTLSPCQGQTKRGINYLAKAPLHSHFLSQIVHWILTGYFSLLGKELVFSRNTIWQETSIVVFICVSSKG